MAIALALLCLSISFLLTQHFVTRRQDAEDQRRLEQVRIGMTEDEVASLMRRKPYTDPGETRRKHFFVWRRASVLEAIWSWNEPTVGKAITIDDGRVTDIRDDMIIR